MPHATAFALNLDEEMLGRHGVALAPPFTADHALPVCVDLAGQLGGRYLIKYVRDGDHLLFRVPHVTPVFGGQHWVTPTVLCPEEIARVLHLPSNLPDPEYALVLDPAKLDARGPRRSRFGTGIEYLLPNGFPSDAILPPGWPRLLT